MTSDNNRVEYLRSLPSVRESSQRVLALARTDALPHFSVDFAKVPGAADYVIDVIRESYPNDVTAVPFHSRWRHFETGNPQRVPNMIAAWDCDALEQARRLIDLALVSVLLDAGAGPNWTYNEPGTNDTYNRSEGLGIASFHLFCSGAFSSNPQQLPHAADADALAQLSTDAIAKGFQVNETSNPLVGCTGRTDLLQRLGHSLKAHPEFFAGAAGTPNRPGNLVDYLLTQQNDKRQVSITSLWRVVVCGLQDIWPATRARIDDQNMGDIWELSYLPEHAVAGKFVCFHKLSQWLTYSLMEPLQAFGIELTDLGLMTGLPEYRNGGLFVDYGVLIPKDASTLTKALEPSDEVIIEWRALTVALLDELHAIVLERLQLTAETFPLVKLLEGGSWKAGRVIAKSKRADGGPPITITSDGTVF